jgi:protein arginine N-methyltransferase 5
MASNKLWNDVKAYSDLAHFETPYVVRLHNVQLLADAQPVFVFEHPNKDRVVDNNRYLSMKFKIGSANTMHGFAGYFDAQLYGDIYISTHPVSYSVGMFSWFPLYFPIRNPIYVEENGEIEVHMWRCVGPTKVWYEWSAVSGPSRSPIHNPAGRSYAIGL